MGCCNLLLSTDRHIYHTCSWGQHWDTNRGFISRHTGMDTLQESICSLGKEPGRCILKKHLQLWQRKPLCCSCIYYRPPTCGIFLFFSLLTYLHTYLITYLLHSYPTFLPFKGIQGRSRDSCLLHVRLNNIVKAVSHTYQHMTLQHHKVAICNLWI